jgi:hypothetical protein
VAENGMKRSTPSIRRREKKSKCLTKLYSYLTKLILSQIMSLNFEFHLQPMLHHIMKQLHGSAYFLFATHVAKLQSNYLLGHFSRL